MKKEVNYIYQLSESDKIRTYFKKNRGKFMKFVIQYWTLVNGKWKSVMRVDTCYGYAHIHTFHLEKREVVVRLSSGLEDSNSLFTKYKEYIIKNSNKIKENFLFSK